MVRGTGPLLEGWDEAIPEGIWAEALVAAVRSDLGALRSPRVLDTLRRWRHQARTAPDAALRAEALQHLREVGDAVAHVPELAARPKERIASVATPAGQLMTADEVILRGEEPTGERHEVRPEEKDRSRPPRQFAEEDEHPTMLRDVVEQLPKRPQLYRAARIDPLAEYDEKPTASINIPDEIQALQARSVTELPTTPPTIHIPQDDTSEVFSSKHAAFDEGGQPLGAEEQTIGLMSPPPLPKISPSSAAPPPLPVVLPPPPLPVSESAPQPSLPPPVPLDDEGSLVESKPSTAGLAPKPGIVRRSNVARRASPARPRAAMQQVRALHAVIVPLCEELIPLNVERRSRRFWARWREVAGDRGVRREFVESLLVSAKDVRTLVCELIAEVQTVDPRSVYALVDKIESSETAERPTGARPGATPDRHRGPLVGAQVRVEGISVDEDT